ncbi:MAG TPA: CPBP family intramembrane glutamic endopeptidase [Planctomycetaceae bacterium]|nr:CPBP family intramembrane glutamic endopeptidase [Planctomycetaceae bacterium]
MTQLAEPLEKPSSGWSGWLFNFGKSAAAPYSAWTGLRVLIACLVLEGFVRPFVREEVRVLGYRGSGTRTLAIASCMLVLAIGLTAVWIRLPLSRVGLYGWRRWTDSEKWFLAQIVALSLLVFPLVEWNQLAAVPGHPAWIQLTLVVFAGQMLWGFYQEYVYRGLLQTELVRRWGTVVGIVASNLLFTFGPLHAYHFSNAFEHPGRLCIFAAIFAIGLYFGVLFQRSGNLWIIALTHGIGDFFMDGVATMH